MSALKVGLVGAGPWAHSFHAPMIAAGPQTELACIWARRPEAARELAVAYKSTAVGSLEALLDRCDAVVFAVPPNVQAEYAPVAAKAGKALLLEKPLGLSLGEAERVAGVILDTGVVTQVMLTNRFSGIVRSFLEEAQKRTALGAIATYINGACLPGGYFATPWRVEKGALLDLGPHVLDIFDAALGPIVNVWGQGNPTRWFTLTARHQNGALSQATLSLTTPTDREITGVRLFTDQGELTMDFVGKDGDPSAPGTIRAEFAAAVAAGVSHEIDIKRALYIQRLLDQAERTQAP